MAEQEAYKFPDEVEANEEAKIEVEVVDDTPEPDRGRDPLPANIVDELEKDDLDEYSDKVKKRLSQLKKVWHDERRAKEAAIREREEAVQFARLKAEEAAQVRQRLGAGEKIYIEEVTKATNAEVAAAKAKLKQAYESGDSDLIADAQEELTDAKLKLKEVQRFKPSLQAEESTVEHAQQAETPQPKRVVDPKAEAWRERNGWFGTNKEMTSLVLGLHETLVDSGMDPRSDEYYQKIDGTMRKRFPEYFELEEAPPQTQEREKPSSRKSATVVAPATRSTAPKKVRLTTSSLAIAKKFGLTPEQYAQEMLKLENTNG